MARGKNEVTLTFAGDSDKLEKAFDDVGASAKGMSDKVDSAGKDVESSFDRAGEATDTLDTRAMGFRDTITGVQDSMLGFSQILKGEFSGEALLLAGMGVGDLASGFTNFLIPSLKSTVGWLGKTKLGMLAQAAAAGVVGAATKVWTGIQAAFNVVMALNPVVLIVLAIIALIAVIVIAWQHSETFRKIVTGAFNFVLKIVQNVWNWIKDNWKLLLAIITGPIGLAVLFITKNWGKIKAGAAVVWNAIKRGFAKVKEWISAPFRAGIAIAKAAISGIRQFWNDNIAGLGFTVPDWVPFIGGNDFRLPRLHTGGVVPGLPGQETLALLQGGERVIPGGGRGGGATTVVVQGGGGSSIEQAFATLVLQLIRTGALTLNVREGRVVAGAA